MRERGERRHQVRNKWLAMVSKRDDVLQRVWELRSAVETHQPTVFHFSGHGNENGICLQNNRRRAETIRWEDLIDIFEAPSTARLLSCLSELVLLRLRRLLHRKRSRSRSDRFSGRLLPKSRSSVRQTVLYLPQKGLVVRRSVPSNYSLRFI